MFNSAAANAAVFCSFHLLLLFSVVVKISYAEDDHQHFHHQQKLPPKNWHHFTEPLIDSQTPANSSSNFSKLHKKPSFSSVHHSDNDLDQAHSWSSPTADTFNRGYFNQINALNHRPPGEHEHQLQLGAEESQLKPSISSPSSSDKATSTSRSNQQENVYYFSPSSYGGRTAQSPPSSPGSSPTQIVSFPKPNRPTNVSGSYSPSRDQILSALNALTQSSDPNNKNKSVQWSVPLVTGNEGAHSNSNIDSRLDLPTSSYSTELNKLLLQKYYNRDLASMTSLLGRYPNQLPPTTGSSSIVDPNTGKRVEAGVEEDTEEGAGEGPEEGTDDGEGTVDNEDEESGVSGPPEGSEKPETIEYYARPADTVPYMSGQPAVHKVSVKQKHPNHIEYKAREGGTVLRVLPSPRHLVRTGYASRLPHHSHVPIRYQTAHSHAVPHYYVPHGIEGGSLGGAGSGGHHHLVGGHDKHGSSSNWLGSGLAAGILIGAIPFGIMMASMMPSLLTTALPIVNTATVAGKRRKRSATSSSSPGNELKNLLLEQTLDTVLGFLVNKGVRDFIGKLNAPKDTNPKKQYSTQKNDQAFEYAPFVDKNSGSSSNSEELFKVMARYALAAVDEPKCIKEAFCTLVAGGRHPQTLPVQKVAYMITKWIPKEIEKGLGLHGLFSAVRNNTCLTTYQCPVSLVDNLVVSSRRRSSQSAKGRN